MPDYTVGDTVFKRFTTRIFATGIPGTLAGTPVVSAYEDDSTTQITAGITLGVDHDSVTGLNLLTIVATGANGYEAGKSYDLVITTGTVSSVSVVGEVVWHFTLSAEAAAVDLANGTDGLGAIKTDTAAILVDTGTTLDAAIAVIDGNVDQIETAVITNAAGVDIAADIIAVKAETALIVADTNELQTDDVPGLIATAQADLDIITGAAGALLDTTATSAQLVDDVHDEVLTGATHNVSNSAGRRLRELEDATLIRGDAFQAGSTTTSVVLDASASAVDDFYNHTIIRIIDGVAADQERVITDYDGTTKAATITPTLVTAGPGSGDEFKIVSGGSVHAETQGGGYEGGAVWIDTSNGIPGTELYVNGTIDNPSLSLADAKTIADALGMILFHFVPGSSSTLATTFNNYEFVGAGYTIAFGGQDIGGSRFFNCAISGTATGSTRAVFRECILVGSTTLDSASLLGCNFAANLTLSAASTYRITDGVHGAATSTVDFGSAVGNTTVHIHGFKGSLTVQNMGQTGTDVLHFDSAGGQLTMDATNIGGTLNLNGTFDFVNNGSGLTINDDGAIIEVIGIPAGADISADIAAVKVDTAAILVDTGTTLDGKIDTIDSNVDAILVDTGTTLDTKIDDIQGATFSSATDSLEAIRDRGDAAWTTGAGGSPPTTLQNTTIATLASQTSFTLTAGSADDIAYRGQMAVVEDSATSTQKAVGVISAYTGSTKTVTLAADPGVFTMAVGDTIDIIAITPALPAAPADAAGGLPISDAGGLDLDAMNSNIDDIETTVDAILVDTGTTLQAELDSIQVAVIDNAAGVDIAADIIAVKAETALIVADTNELQTDWVNGGRLDLILDTVAADVVNIDGAAMRGTDSAALASVCTETRLAELDAANLPTDVDDILVDTADIQPKLGTPAADISADIASIQTDTDDIQTRLPAALVGGRVDANISAIANVAAAATQLSLSADTVVNGTASGTPTTTTMVSDVSITVDDQLNGRIIIFADNTTTAALRDQATDITACTASSNTLTFTALTTAPASGDTFVIV